MNKEEKRKRLATLIECASALFQCEMITSGEYEEIHQRIRKWQKKNDIKITPAQLTSVKIVYNDNAN